jgi:hypothetical protein
MFQEQSPSNPKPLGFHDLVDEDYPGVTLPLTKQEVIDHALDTIASAKKLIDEVKAVPDEELKQVPNE